MPMLDVPTSCRLTIASLSHAMSPHRTTGMRERAAVTTEQVDVQSPISWRFVSRVGGGFHKLPYARYCTVGAGIRESEIL